MKDTVNNLKERPKEDRVAVATSVAGVVMIIIFIGWGYFFLKKIAAGEPVETSWGAREDVVDFSSIEEATRQFNETYYNAQEELRQIRDAAAQAELDRTRANASSDIFIDTSDSSSNSSGSGGFGL
jgi:uncharacterized protein (DUF1330 family)